jgi:hypothetical protein
LPDYVLIIKRHNVALQRIHKIVAFALEKIDHCFVFSVGAITPKVRSRKLTIHQLIVV